MAELISRQKALEALGEEPPVWYNGEDEIAERDQWRRDVAAIEAVECAEPKTGKWIEESDNHGHSSYFCSRCGTQEGEPSGFCPNCGARMSEEEVRG